MRDNLFGRADGSYTPGADEAAENGRFRLDCRAQDAIARGEEAGLAYSGARELMGFGESGPHRWSAPDSVLRPSLHASPAGPIPTPEAAPAPPPAVPAPVRPARPDIFTGGR
jgi:hypothetical protein